MIKVFDREGIQGCDRAAIERYRIPGLVLMENAGVQVLEALTEHFGGTPPMSVAVLCGKGNNGGDGLVLARHLHNLGRDVVVYLLVAADRLAGDAARNHEMVTALGVSIQEITDSDALAEAAGALARFDLIVDAVLGTGVTGAARGLAAEAITAMNGAGVPVVAVDLPSGLSADSGSVPGQAVQAELTVTFAAPKACHVLPPACVRCGQLQVADISIPQAVLQEAEPLLVLAEPSDLAGLLPDRSPTAHKGQFGRVLVVGGSPGMAGAVVLAARAAARAGAGLVHVACPESVYGIVGAQLTECLVHPLPADADGGIGSAARGAIERLAETASVLVAGPGAGMSVETRRLLRSLAGELPRAMILDADALNALAGHLESLQQAPAARVLTPHPGEAARLLGSDVATVQGDRLTAVRSLCEQAGAAVLLKGYRSLLADGDRPPVVVPTGNPGMATGGSGDVLTGVIAALIAQGIEPARASWAGAYIHGLAGDLAAERVGEVSLMAGDLVEVLPAALSDAMGGEPT